MNSMPNDSPEQHDRLDSWKAIARHFGRTSRTVQRWHSEYGLPIRHLGGNKSSIFAYAEELDDWMRNRGRALTVEPGEMPGRVLVSTAFVAEEPVHQIHRPDPSLVPEPAKTRSRELVDLAYSMWETLSHGNLQAIVRFLREAIDQDPTNAAAFGGLSLALIAEGLWGDLRPSAAYLSARAAVLRALEIDPELIEAKCADAWLKTISTRDWGGARRGFGEILKHRSLGTRAMNGRALLYIGEGCLEEASSLLLEAAEQNPLNSSVMGLYCWTEYLSGDYANALDQIAQVKASGRSGRITDAIEALASIQLEDSETHIDRLEALAAASPHHDILRGALGYAYGVAGHDRKAKNLLDAMAQAGTYRRACEPYATALILIGIEESHKAVEYLERSYAEGSLWSLGFRSDPILEPLCNDPRYRQFLSRAGYPDCKGPSPRLLSAG